VRIVRVEAAVSEGARSISGLNKDDFVLYDESDRTPIRYFCRESDPMSLLLLLDVSGSMRKYIDQMSRTAQQALRALHTGDRVAVMVFSRAASLREDFTPNHELIAYSLRRAASDDNVGGGTAINAALMQAAPLFDKEGSPEAGRRVILILTDNQSLNYQSPDEAVIRELGDRNIVLDAIVVGKNGRVETPKPGRYVNPDFSPADVFHIAEETGGEALRAERVETSFGPLLERIRTRYDLEFQPRPAPKAGYHHLRVALTPDASRRYPRAVIRARAGYYGE
jgi:VWFA-related protein